MVNFKPTLEQIQEATVQLNHRIEVLQISALKCLDNNKWEHDQIEIAKQTLAKLEAMAETTQDEAEEDDESRYEIDDYSDDSYALASAGHGSDEDY